MVASPAQATSPSPSSVSNLTITDAANWEGGSITFTLTYNGTNPGTFTFATANGTAHGVASPSATDGTEDFSTTLSRSDFTFPGTASGASNTTTVTVTTQADDDTADEAFTLVATDTNTDTKSATGTIWAASTYPTFTLKGPSAAVAETATNGVQKTVTVTAALSDVLPHPVTIPVSTADGSRGGGLDATSSNGEFRDYDALPAGSTITIPAYSYTGTINVTLHDDSLHEVPTQYFNVTAGTTYGPQPFGGTQSPEIGIKDDDPVPTVSIGDADSATEGDYLHFPITVSAPSELAVTVNANSASGVNRADSNPATTGDDYFSATDTPAPITIAPYTRSKYLDVHTKTDGAFEGPENVKAVLSGTPTNATLGTPTTAYGIIDDANAGPTPTVTTALTNNGDSWPSGSSFLEGASGEVARKIHVSVGTGTYAVPIKVDYAFKDLTATNGVDYRGASGSYTFPANTAVDDGFDIPVTIIGDTIKEGVDPGGGHPWYENFEVDFTSSTSTITAAQLPIRITEGADDVTPTWSMSNVSVHEGDSGTTIAKVPVILSAPAADDTTFSLNLTDGTATESGVNSGATAGANDYDWPADRTLTIPAGSTVGYFQIPINGDTVYENDETFVAAATDTSENINDTPAAGTLQSSAVTIVNDDAKPSITFNNVSAGEGSTLRVTGTINGQSQYDYKLGFSIAGAATDPATPGVDFDTPDLTTDSLTVPRGTTGSLTAGTLAGTPFPYNIYLNPDTIDEATEAFTFTATEITPSPTGFTTSVGTYKITDDPADLPPAASVNDATVKESGKTVAVPVDLSFDSTNGATSTTQTVTIPWYTVDGTAKAGEDYVKSSGTLSVAAGTATGTINVPIIDDKRAEGTENFYVKLGTPGPQGAAVDKGTGEVTIISDDTGSAPTIKVPPAVTGASVVSITGVAAPSDPVELWGAPWGSATLTKLDTAMANSSGAFGFKHRIAMGYQFQARSGGLKSAVAKVEVNQDPKFTASSGKGKLSLSVTGDPHGANQSVVVQRLIGGKWVTTWKGMTGTNHRWSATVKERSGSSWTLRAYVAGSSGMGINGGYSATKKVTIK